MASLKEKHLILAKAKPFFAIFLFLTCWSPAASFWFFSCRHGNGRGDVGDPCSLFCRCRSPNTCEAGVQRCVSPGQLHDPCHMTKPCGKGLSCHPGIQRCYHVPRRLHEPCVAGFDCGSGLSCHPGIQVCYHAVRRYNEPCVAGFPCGPGLTCQPGLQRCLHFPRREGERCSLGFECGEGLECTMCGGEPYLTCQMNRVPNMGNEFYNRPYNKVAFLVTHNSFSNSMKYVLWVRNQRVGIRRQLLDGVRGFMLDIYPGWGDVEVQLCHANCFWGGSSSLLDTLIEIRAFMEENPREVITIIFEDYLRNPIILKRVFDQSGLSSHVFTSDLWGTRYKSWPTLTDMRRLGRLVVFNNNGLDGFPYSHYNMWYSVRENKYGQPGLDTTTCVDRGESTFNANYNTEWSLVLVNWFGTMPNPFNPCLNPFDKLKEKLNSCYKAFGQQANFLAVDYYQNGVKGGAFKAVHWLNEQWKEQFQKKKSSKTWSLYDTMFTKLFHHTNSSMLSVIPNMDQETATNTTQPYMTDKKNRTMLTHNATHSHVKTNHVINETAAMDTSLNMVQMTNNINNLTNSQHFPQNNDMLSNNLTNTSNHVIEMTTGNDTSIDMMDNATNYTTYDHVINSTNEVKYTGNHVINMTNMSKAESPFANLTSQEVGGYQEIDMESMTNVSNSLTNMSNHKTKDIINETSLFTNTKDIYETNETDSNDNTTNNSQPALFDWLSDKTASLNSSDFYFGSDTNSTNKSMTYDVNSTNSKMVLARRVQANRQSNTTTVNKPIKSSLHAPKADLDTPDNVSIRNYLMDANSTDNSGNNSWRDGNWQEKSLSSQTDIMDNGSEIDEDNTVNNQSKVDTASQDTNFALTLPDGYIRNDTNELTNQTMDISNKYNDNVANNDTQQDHYLSFSDNNNTRLSNYDNTNRQFPGSVLQHNMTNINNTNTSLLNQYEYSSAVNDSTALYNGVELRKGLIKILGYQDDSQLEEYIDQI